MKLKICFSTLLFYIFFTTHAFAYIDPGTGSIILHAILAFIATCFAWIVAKYKEIKSFMKKKLSKKKTSIND